MPNIYRQLGVNFYDNPDYKNLIDYCYASGSEIRISEVVYNEFISYYNREIIDKSVKDIENATKKINHIPELQSCTNTSFDSELIENAKDFIKRKLFDNALLLRNLYVPVDLLSDFLVKNKQETKKDNTRDFLIWLTVITEANKNKNDQIILITNDKIYTENEYFKDLIDELKLNKRVLVFDSISDVLNRFGEQYDFLNSELILSKISKSKIEKEIKKDINSFPSYISEIYYHTRKKFIIENFEIEKIEIDSYYAFKEIETSKSKFLTHVKVYLNIIFEKEKEDIVRKHLEKLPEWQRNLETFDSEFRPVFKKEILFIFEGELNPNKETITRVKYIDFIIDYYFDKYKTAAPIV